MAQKSFSQQLWEAMHAERGVSHLPQKSAKLKLLSTLEVLEERSQQKMMLSHLKHYYRPVPRARQDQIKAAVFESVREQPQLGWRAEMWLSFTHLSRKMVAISFVLLLLLPAFFGPLETFRTPQLFPAAHAAYLECSGTVYLNGQLCRNDQLSEVNVGDAITTDQGSFATIFFSDFTLARLADATQAVVDDVHQQQLHLVEGGVWLHARGFVGKDSVQVSTPFVKALVPQGAAGVVTKGSLTQLYTTTAAVEVQIDNAAGSSEVLTLAPEKKLVVRQTNTSAQVKETSFDSSRLTWVQNNTAKDAVYLQDVKKKSSEYQVADSATGSETMGDYVDKAAQSALTALVGDSQASFDQQLSDLNILFAETMSLLDKGDKTTAATNFEAYRSKFISLVQQSSDTIRPENSEQEKKLLLDVLQNHSQLVSLFSPDEPQYVLKHALQQLTVNLDAQALGGANTSMMIADVGTKKLMEAHGALLEGKTEIAKNMLSDALALLNRSPSSLSGGPADLAILDTIAEKYPQLSVLAKEIKKKKVDQLRSLTPQQNDPDLVGSSFSGSAGAPSSGDEQATPSEASKAVSAVGQALKQDSTL